MKNYILFKHPYVLIEDLKGKYQSIYKEYTKEIPSIYFKSPTLCSPFLKARRSHIPKKKSGNKIGYCEICFCRYENYKSHIVSKDHVEFAEKNNNYAKIDEFIKELNQENKYNEYINSESPCDKIAAEYFGNTNENSGDSSFSVGSVVKLSWISSVDVEMNSFNTVMNKMEKKF